MEIRKGKVVPSRFSAQPKVGIDPGRGEALLIALQLKLVTRRSRKPQYASIARSTTERAIAKGQSTEICGARAYQASEQKMITITVITTQSARLRLSFMSVARLPSNPACTYSSFIPYRLHSRSAASCHCSRSFSAAEENEITPTPTAIRTEPPITCPKKSGELFAPRRFV